MGVMFKIKLLFVCGILLILISVVITLVAVFTVWWQYMDVDVITPLQPEAPALSQAFIGIFQIKRCFLDHCTVSAVRFHEVEVWRQACQGLCLGEVLMNVLTVVLALLQPCKQCKSRRTSIAVAIAICCFIAAALLAACVSVFGAHVGSRAQLSVSFGVAALGPALWTLSGITWLVAATAAARARHHHHGGLYASPARTPPPPPPQPLPVTRYY